MTTTDAVSNSVLQSLASQGASTAPATPTTGNQTLSQADFLQLFVAQLQNQDPLSPLDPDQMSAQLAQFASLEQLTGVNTRLDNLTSVARSSVIDLIGKQVQFDGNQLAITNGQASSMNYTLANQASTVTATVQAADGSTVRVVDLGAQGTGAHVFQFDGRSDTGAALPDGTYTVNITATGTDQTTPVQVTMASRGTVNGIDFSVDPPVVLVGSLRIPLAQVGQVNLGGTSTGQGS
jgi:flagellar basal-body rod modification protein FlgD